MIRLVGTLALVLGTTNAIHIRGDPAGSIEDVTSNASVELNQATAQALANPQFNDWATKKAVKATEDAEAELQASMVATGATGSSIGGATGSAATGGGATGATGATGGATGASSTGSATGAHVIKLWLDSPKCNFNGDHHIVNGCLCKQGHNGKNCEFKVLSGKQGRFTGMSECQHGQREGSACRCDHGFSGFHCDKPTIACDLEHGKVECAGTNSHCGHDDKKRCRCEKDWSGAACDQDTSVAATGVAGSSATGIDSATGAAPTGATGIAATGGATGTAATGGNSAPAAPVVAAPTKNIVVDQPNTEQRFAETQAETQASSWNMETYLESFRL